MLTQVMRKRSVTRRERGDINKLRTFTRRRYEDSDEKFIDSEVYNDLLTGNSLSAANVEPAGSSNSLNYIQEGAGVSDRVGRKYLLTGIQVRGRIAYQAPNGAADTPIARILLYCDKRTNSGNGAASVLLSTPANTQNTVHVFRALGTEERFDVFVDRDFVFRPAANVSDTETTDSVWNFDFYVDLTPYAYECEGPANYTTPTNYNLRMAVLTNNIGDMRLSYIARTRFKG